MIEVQTEDNNQILNRERCFIFLHPKHFTLLLTALLLMSVATSASGQERKRNPETTAKIVKFDEATAAATASTLEILRQTRKNEEKIWMLYSE